MANIVYGGSYNESGSVNSFSTKKEECPKCVDRNKEITASGVVNIDFDEAVEYWVEITDDTLIVPRITLDKSTSKVCVIYISGDYDVSVFNCTIDVDSGSHSSDNWNRYVLNMSKLEDGNFKNTYSISATGILNGSSYAASFFPLSNTTVNPVYGNTGNNNQVINGQPYYFVPNDGIYFTDPPTDFTGLLRNSDINDSDLSLWDVSNVTNMLFMFQSAEDFNQDIGGWDVSNATSMSRMLEGSLSFNQDLSGWCVSQFPSEPFNFSLSTPNWAEPKPIWGTCP